MKRILWLAIVGGFVPFFAIKYITYEGGVEDRLLRSLLFSLIGYPLAIAFGFLLYWIVSRSAVALYLQASDSEHSTHIRSTSRGAWILWSLVIAYATLLGFAEFRDFGETGALRIVIESASFLAMLAMLSLVQMGYTAVRYFLAALLIGAAFVLPILGGSGRVTSEHLLTALIGGLLAWALLGSADVRAYLDAKRKS